MAATLRDYCDSETLFFNFPHATTTKGAQTITPTEQYVLETIKFYATYKYGDPGTCYISVQTTSGGVPTGSLITNRASFTVTADKVLKNITFTTQPILEIGTKYVIVFEVPSGEVSVKEIHLYGSASSGTHYTGGDRLWYDGASWNTVTTQDLNFACWGSAATPGTPTTPSPTNAASNVTLDQATITWVSGGNTATYNVYYGDNAAAVAAADNTDETGIYRGNQVGTSFTITDVTLGSPFDYLVARYWRIDAVNDAGTTTGVAWSFVCIAFDPPLPTGVTLDASGDPTGTPTGENNMITIRKLVTAANSKVWFEDI